MNDEFPLWPCWVLGLIAAVSGGICLALRIDPGWAVIGTTFAGIPVFALVELRRPRSVAADPPQLQRNVDVDEEFVRCLETLASRMRAELDERRARTAG
jgi:hypothetical protein